MAVINTIAPESRRNARPTAHLRDENEAALALAGENGIPMSVARNHHQLSMPKAYSYIRMSTDAQLAGDSLRRQTDRTRQFVKKHDLTLDDTFKLSDIGYSAFDGSNIQKGALGRFLEVF